MRYEHDSDMFGNKKLCMGCMKFYKSEYDVCPHCGYAEDTPFNELLHIEPGTLLQNRYIIGRSIGYGGFGVTYIAWDALLKRRIAIKEYMPSEFSTRILHHSELTVANTEKKQKQFYDGLVKFKKEAEKLAKVSNVEGIVRVYDSFEDNNTAYITMEYLEGETLSSYLEREGTMTEQQTLDLLMPILESLEIVHNKGIIHRDIAPDNIFLTKDNNSNLKAKLIDFGSAKYATTSHSKSLTVIIKPGYSPEEQYRSNGDQGIYTDVYALAAVIYKMVTGIVPPDAFERRTYIESQKKDLLKDPSIYNKDLSDNFETAIINAMNVRIEDRTATLSDFVSELISFEPVSRRCSSIKKIDFMKWPIWAKIAVPTAGVVSLGLLILLTTGLIKYSANLIEDYSLPEGMARVPDIVNEDFDEVQTWMEDAGLTINTSGTEYYPNVRENLVLEQDIAAGSIVRENTVVTVKISTVEEIYALPDVIGMNVDDAIIALECMGVVVETKSENRPGLCANAISSQDINPYSEIRSGQVITLGVNYENNAKTAIVPEFTNLNYENALDIASAAGVNILITEKHFSKEYENKTIISQKIKAGESIDDNTVVEVEVALPWREFPMPNLMYKNKTTAIQILKNMGIEADVENEISEIVAEGKVMNQAYEPLTSVEPEQIMTLTISKGGEPFEMPDVRKLAESEGQSLLLSLGAIVIIEYDYDANIKDGCIISQNVEAGKEVSRGTEIVIVVNSTKDLVAVENVIGKNKDNAKKILEEKGFKVQMSEAYSDTVSKGSVISQLPESGSLQKKDTIVTLTISRGKEEIKKEDTSSNGGTWSDWMTSLPSGINSSGYYIDQKTQYRSRNIERTASSNPSMSGWTLYNQESSWGPYGNWSEWTTNNLQASDSQQIEKKVQYRYRDKETTTSNNSSLNGWTQIGSSSAWTDYGAWSGWQDSAVSASDSRKVETRTVYGYYYFQCPNCGRHMHGHSLTCPTWAGGCGNATIPESSWHAAYSPTSWEYANLQEWYGTGKYYTTILDGAIWFKWPEGGYKTQYRYCDRSYVTTYSYERWGEWSDWSDSAYAVTNTRLVESRTVYRSRSRQLINTYYFERYSAWSNYSDVKPSGSNIEIQTRVVYRYKKK